MFIYQGPDLAATVKDQYKMHWTSADPGQAKSGLTAVYDLYNDHREHNPIVVGGFHMKEPFKRMRARHELWKKKYPDGRLHHGPAYTGISNARPETLGAVQAAGRFEGLALRPAANSSSTSSELPFDPASEPGPGQ